MVHLIRQRPRVVQHGELMQAVWRRADISRVVLARALMEARQACGEPADEPRLFVTVHGVGYRFAGEVSVEAAPGNAADDFEASERADQAIEQLRSTVRQARLAVAEQRMAEAQAMADEALAQAQELGVQSEKVRALLVCASVATAGGRMAEAARLAHHALQTALTEGHPPLIAEARVATGGVHVLAGDRATGIRHLQEALEVFSAPGHEANLTRCLNWLARALRDQGELEAALEACRRSVALTDRCRGPAFTRMDRLNELQLLTELGDRLEEAGHAPQASARFQEGLAAAESLLTELADGEHAVDRATCLDHLSVLLERLGRIEEARAAAKACDAQRKRLPEGVEWPDVEDLPRFRIQRARLACHADTVESVLAEVDDILRAGSDETPGEGQANLYRLAADIATRRGAHERASQWLKKRSETMIRAQCDRSASLAAILAAELNANALKGELERVRSESRDLLIENGELRRRLRQLEGRLALSPQTGLAPGEQLYQLLGLAHERARERELPMCLGLLRPAAVGQGGAALQAGAVVPLLRRAAEVLAGHPDVGGLAFDIGHGLVAFQVRESGLARARTVCEEVAERLGTEAWLLAAASSPLCWQWAAADASGFETLQACVQSLVVTMSASVES